MKAGLYVGNNVLPLSLPIHLRRVPTLGTRNAYERIKPLWSGDGHTRIYGSRLFLIAIGVTRDAAARRQSVGGRRVETHCGEFTYIRARLLAQ